MSAYTVHVYLGVQTISQKKLDAVNVVVTYYMIAKKYGLTTKTKYFVQSTVQKGIMVFIN